MEMVQLVLSFFVSHDDRMYDATTDTAASARTAHLQCDLGQLSHVFSDKTGTVTANRLTLVAVSVQGVMYPVGRLAACRLVDPDMDAFVHALALCHDVFPEEDAVAGVTYQGPSPDEVALVSAARDAGVECTRRDPAALFLTCSQSGRVVEQGMWRLLALIPVRQCACLRLCRSLPLFLLAWCGAACCRALACRACFIARLPVTVHA